MWRLDEKSVKKNGSYCSFNPWCSGFLWSCFSTSTLGLKAAIEINSGTRKKKSLWKANRAKESRNQWFCFPHNTQLICTNPVPRPYILSGGIFSPASSCSKTSANRLWIEKQEKKGAQVWISGKEIKKTLKSSPNFISFDFHFKTWWGLNYNALTPMSQSFESKR